MVVAKKHGSARVAVPSLRADEIASCTNEISILKPVQFHLLYDPGRSISKDQRLFLHVGFGHLNFRVGNRVRLSVYVRPSIHPSRIFYGMN